MNCLAGYPVRCVRFPAPRRERKLCWKRQKAGRQCELASGLCINRWNVAHQRDLPCQDACQMQIAWLNDQQPLLSVFVADGAGSVSQGGEGAMLAVNEAMAYMSQKCRAGNWGLIHVLATNMVLTIRQRLLPRRKPKN